MTVGKGKIISDSHRNRSFMNECFRSLKIVAMHTRRRFMRLKFQLATSRKYLLAYQVAEMFQKGNMGLYSTELALRKRDFFVHMLPVDLQMNTLLTIDRCWQLYTSLFLNHEFYGIFLLSPQKICQDK